MQCSDSIFATGRSPTFNLAARITGLYLLFTSLVFAQESGTSAPLVAPVVQAEHTDLATPTATQQESLLLSCAAEHAKFCGSSDSAFNCLITQRENLGQCCISKIDAIQETGPTDKPIDYKGVILPAGTTLTFDYFCDTATAITTESTNHGHTSLAAGPIVFDSAGNVSLARLIGEHSVQGLPLATDQPLTLFFENGTPKNIRLASTGVQHGITFGPMAELEKQSARSPELSTIPVKYLYQLAMASAQTYDPGTTRLHNNGRVALGRVMVPMTINGMPIAPGVTEFSETGNIVSGELSGPFEYNGWKLTKGKIEFSSNAKLRTAVLAENVTLNQWRLNVPSRITMNYDGTPKSLLLGSEDSNSNRHGDVKVDSLWLSKSVFYQLLPNGQIEKAQLQDHSWYRGKMYPKGTSMKFNENGDVSWDSFYDEFLVRAANGRVREKLIPAILPTAEVQRGFLIPAGSLVYPVTRRGDQRFVVPFPFEYRGLHISAGEFLLDSQNNITRAKLDGDQTLNGLKLKGRPYTIGLYANGTPRSGILAGDQRYHGLPLKGYPYTTVLSSTGKIVSATLAQQTLIDGISFAPLHPIEFGSDRQVRSGVLSTPYVRGNLTFKAGTNLRLDAQGNITSGVLGVKTVIGSVEIPADSLLRTSRGNKLTIKTKQLINAGPYRFSGNDFSLTDDGSQYSGTLEQDAVISGTTLKSGTWISMNATGQLRSSRFVGLPHQLGTNSVALLVGRKVPPMPALTKTDCKRFLDNVMQERGYWLSDRFLRVCVLMLAERE